MDEKDLYIYLDKNDIVYFDIDIGLLYMLMNNAVPSKITKEDITDLLANSYKIYPEEIKQIIIEVIISNDEEFNDVLKKACIFSKVDFSISLRKARCLYVKKILKYFTDYPNIYNSTNKYIEIIDASIYFDETSSYTKIIKGLTPCNEREIEKVIKTIADWINQEEKSLDLIIK